MWSTYIVEELAFIDANDIELPPVVLQLLKVSARERCAQLPKLWVSNSTL